MANSVFIGSFVGQNVRGDELPKDAPRIRVLGRSLSAGGGGSTTINVSIDPAGGICASYDIRVGGLLTVEYDHAPTQKTGGLALRGAPRGPPLVQPESRGGGGAGGAFTLGLDGRPFLPEVVERAEGIGDELMTKFRVTLLDADGNPKRGRPIKLETRPDDGGGALIHVRSDAARALITTNENGQATVTYGAEMDSVTDPQAGVVGMLRIGFVVGERARALADQPSLLNAPDAIALNQAITQQTFSDHFFRGWGLKDEGFMTGDEQAIISVLSLRLPIINHAHFVILKHYAEELQWEELPEETLTGRDLLLTDPDTGAQFTWTVGEDPARVLALSSTTSLIRQQLQFTFPNFDTSRPPAGDSPPGWDGTALTVGAIVAEIALSLVPGADIKDIFIEAIWKPCFQGEDTNWLVAGMALVGLMADAGYVLPIVGMPVNLAAGILKTVFKRVSPGTVKAVIQMADTARESASRLYQYIARLPPPPGANQLEHAAACAIGLIDQWNKILQSPLRLGPSDVAKTQNFLAQRMTKFVTKEAAEGVAAILKNVDGGEDALIALRSRIAGEAADDSVESIAEAAGKTLRRNPDADGVPEALDLQRTNEALATALNRQASVYDGAIESFLGPSHIIKSREEFDALRHMRGEDLTQDQVVALNTIRAFIGTPAAGTPIRRIVKMEGLHGAIAMVADGSPNLARWFSRADELDGLTSAADFAQALRIQGLENVQAFAILESKVTASMANEIKLPLTGRYHELSQSSRKYDFMADEGNSPNFPNTNNAQIPSLDNKYRTENYLPGSGSPMLADGQTTVLRFRLNNGTTPHRVPIPVDGEIVEASDWALIPHPSLPGQFKWIPIE